MNISPTGIFKFGAYKAIPDDHIIEKQRYVLFGIYTFAGLLIYLIYGMEEYAQGLPSYNHFAIFTCVAVTLFMNYLMVQIHKYLELAYTISIIAGLILIHAFTYDVGGIRNPDLIYSGLIILYSYIVLGNHGGKITFFLSMANIIFFYVLTDFTTEGKFISFISDGDEINRRHLITAITSMVLLTALSMYLENAKNITIFRVKESRDILQVKNTELEELSLVASETENAIIITSNRGVITWVNDGFERLTGYTIDESIGRNMKEFLFGNLSDQQIATKLSYCDFETPSYHAEILLYRNDGTTVWVEQNVTRVYDDEEGTTKYIFIGTDVTERKHAEVQMEEYLRNLEGTNMELDKFAYVVSHDLKAPLRAIGNLTGWIEEDTGHLLPENVRTNFNLIKNRVIRMESLINGILEYSKASKKKNQYELFDSAKLINDCYDLLGKPENCEIEIQSGMPVIFADKIKFEQVFLNLISNAIKFNSKSSKHIKVSFRDESDHFRFTVSDNGPGIDPKFHDKIFVIFQTINTRDEFESSGVGLAIVKKVVEEEGGKIWLESVINEGSSFHFTWPKSTILETEAQINQEIEKKAS